MSFDDQTPHFENEHGNAEEQPVLNQDGQQDVEPLPAPDVPEGQPPLVESSVDGPGLSPLAHNPDLVTESPETAPTVPANGLAPETNDDDDDLDDRIAAAKNELNQLEAEKNNQPIPPPANVPSNPATGKVDNLGNPDAIQCPTCQALFVPQEHEHTQDHDGTDELVEQLDGAAHPNDQPEDEQHDAPADGQ